MSTSPRGQKSSPRRAHPRQPDRPGLGQATEPAGQTASRGAVFKAPEQDLYAVENARHGYE